ncbi:MAG: GNAT family protein, partial [Planctomycetota bacterium]
FFDLGLQRVEANLIPRNEASRGLVRALGFRYEGYSPRYIQIRGKREDHERWAIDRQARRAHLKAGGR